MGLGQGTQDSPNIKFGGGWSLGQADRPARSANLAHGLHCLSLDAWQLLTGSQGRFQGVELQSSAESTMDPSYIYMMGGVPFETHHQV